MINITQCTDIADIKEKLRYYPKDEKLLSIKQEISNRALGNMVHINKDVPVRYAGDNRFHHVSKDELDKLCDEIENNFEAYESDSKRKELIPFIYDRDLDWYFNVKNIPNQKNLVLPIYEYLTLQDDIDFTPIDFLNLLYCQYKHVSKNIEKPIAIIKHIKSIPITERERHTLYGFILKFYGGHPIQNMDTQHQTTLTFLEKEFLAYDGITPEKEFCQLNWNTHNKIKGLEKLLVKDINNIPDGFPDWQQIQEKVAGFETIPDKLKYLIETQSELKGDLQLRIEIGMIEADGLNNKLDLEIDKWAKLLAIANTKEKSNLDENNEETPLKNLTNSQLVLLFYYFFSHNGLTPRESIDIAPIAKFIHLITGKEFKATTSSDIYQKLQKAPLLKKSDKELAKDLQKIKDLLQTYKLNDIAQTIEKELTTSRGLIKQTKRL